MGLLSYIASRLLLLARELAMVLVPPLLIRYQHAVCRRFGHDTYWPAPDVRECRRCGHAEGSLRALSRLWSERLMERERLKDERGKRLEARLLELHLRAVDRTV